MPAMLFAILLVVLLGETTTLSGRNFYCWQLAQTLSELTPPLVMQQQLPMTQECAGRQVLWAIEELLEHRSGREPPAVAMAMDLELLAEISVRVEETFREGEVAIAARRLTVRLLREQGRTEEADLLEKAIEPNGGRG